MGQHISRSTTAQALTIELDELLALIQEVNKKCFETALSNENPKFICFAIKNGSTESILWKATVRICCFSKIQGEEAADIKPGRTFTLRQFLRLYQAIGPLLEAAQFNPNKILEHPDIMTSSIFQDSTSSEGECVICLEREPDTILPCAHAYCSKCIADCQRYHQKCPLCRIGSTDDEDQWVVPEVPETDKIKNYVDQLAKPS